MAIRHIRRRGLAAGAAGVVLVTAAYGLPAAAHGDLLARFLHPGATSAAAAPALTTPTTPEPTTQEPTTPEPTTQEPTTQEPTTQEPTTQEPTSASASASDLHARIVQASCTAAVLDSPSGSWLVTAAHCDVPESIEAAGRTWTVIDHVTTDDVTTAGTSTEDLALLRVDGDIEAAVGGGFVVGTAPVDGSAVSIWGYPSATGELIGCDQIAVTVRSNAIAVDDCDLPDGTSGSPWYTADGVLHGVTGGPDDGGTSDWDTESIRFTDDTVAWIRSVVG
ncbi:trypsin-like serine peptidase [Raineyella fluvialis]|uniref:Trypsin n=1 Tax=Raineyella fluvialis TaxID=2662261 RepID=A0A5Q2F8F6_9ACTN|nr:trypsin-like peptidase domain-containing protein [Raineyella fluvialis]QGF23109.1 hypothetical protein Rai3103_04885 [Raineyella fluvialis]